MLDSAQRFDDPLATLKAAASNALADTWTALPGIIVSFDPATLLAEVQPAIKRSTTAADGTVSSAPRAMLVDVPVCFPGGGGCTLTFPVAKGDECLLVFSARGIDAWKEYGDTQDALPERRHDLSDAIALVGVRSKSRQLGTPASSKTQLRSDDGSAYVELDPTGHIVNVVAPGGMTITTPTLHITGDVNVDQTLTATTDVVGGGKSLKTHTHSGVTTGGGVSGPPV